MVNGKQSESDRQGEPAERTERLPSGTRSVDRRSFVKAAGAAATIPLLAEGVAGASTSHKLEIVSTNSSSETGSLNVTYEFTATGRITKDTDDGRNSAEGNDSVVQNADGTWTATGKTGNGFGDCYAFEGSVTDFSAQGSYELRLDGSTVTVDELVSSRRHIEVVTTEDPSELDYAFTTTGEITKDTDNGDRSAAGNDSVTQNADGTWTADGYTGNGYGDAYYFQGELTDFGPVKDFVEVYVDGTKIDLSQYESTTSTASSTDNHIGGGDGYPNAVPESAADVVVSTLDELLNALDAASSGDIVYVAGDATIDASPVTGTDKLSVPAGVTLASDRGIDGAAGGTIETDVIDYSHMMSAEGGARVTGVRLVGPIDSYVEYSKPVVSGLTVKGDVVEVENCEVTGFNHAGLKLNASAHVHHSHVHGNSMDGLGYGIMCYGGQKTLVEYNKFNFNRHCVANEGTAGYEVRYNLFTGKTIAYQVGTHRPGATTLEIHHNTFVPTKHLNDGIDPSCHVTVRGVPDDVADIHHNWFHNPKEPLESPDMWTNEAIVQAFVDEWTNVEYADNHYGADEPADDVGCPR
ncbi:MAG: right-handed parallel beta-helix repeat-containing protein [Halosimplex sp.]